LELLQNLNKLFSFKDFQRQEAGRSSEIY